MCRNIRPLYNFEPPATSEEVRAAALQYVRKISGFTKPSQANQEAFDRAVDEIAHVSQHLLDALETARAAEGPRGRGREAARPLRAAIRRLTPGRAGFHGAPASLAGAMDPLIVLFGLGVGILVGLTGIGGGSLMTPLLLLVGGYSPVVAIGTDLAYGAVTKTVGGWRHLRAGHVDLRLSWWLAAGSVPGLDPRRGRAQHGCTTATARTSTPTCWRSSRRR